jgi:beta-lactamase superfamily II metal-dependent hydrolase
MPKRRSNSTPTNQPATSGKLVPPENGATVRMYRTGHGDCFLLAFAGEPKPVYMLIDCGYKPGSPKFINTKIADITKNIREATGGHLDVAVITHEHQDHVNGITETHFKGITIGETWLAWTEDPGDDLANSLRKAFKDKLLGLLAARNRLAVDGNPEQLKRVDEFLEFELGWDSETGTTPTAQELLAAADDSGRSLNKKSMKLFKDRPGKPPKYLYPHQEILTIPGAKDLRIFALGPPYDVDKIKDLDPQGEESFRTVTLAATSTSPGNYFLAALDPAKFALNLPFSRQYSVPLDQAAASTEFGDFFTKRYGQSDSPVDWTLENGIPRTAEVPNNPEWRQIKEEWLYSAEQLALDLNDYTNNSSLVLAFELGRGGKVLLFAADAQRGNWVSWSEKNWKDGNATITARDLLARTVLYKVGHHGSHNATLSGDLSSEHASLGWMAQGASEHEFTAMITAVRAWAETQKGWDHPLKAIKDALLKKASGRVFQTDTDFEKMATQDGVVTPEWKQFQSHASGNQLYFDYKITT